MPGLVKVAMNPIVMRSGLGPMARTSSGLLVAGALLAQTLSGCQTINSVNPFAPTFTHGKVALCPSAASVGAAVVVVTDTDKNRPGVQTIPRDTPPLTVTSRVPSRYLPSGIPVADVPSLTRIMLRGPFAATSMRMAPSST